MTEKTVFVLGDSYSYHDNIPIVCSWPAHLANIDQTLTVINGSIPGSSLDSLFYRSLEMERTFGKPDLVLVLLTFPWRLWYMTDREPLLDLQEVKDRYYAPVSYRTSYVVPNLFGDKPREQLLEQRTNQSIGDLKTLHRLQTAQHHQWWRAVKEVLLLKSYYANTVFMSWAYDYRAWLDDINANYIGTAEELLGNQFAQCKMSKSDDHFTEYGHGVIAPVIYEKIKPFLTK